MASEAAGASLTCIFETLTSHLASDAGGHDGVKPVPAAVRSKDINPRCASAPCKAHYGSCFVRALDAPSLDVVSEVRSVSAPAVLLALAGVVHDRQGAAGQYHKSGGDDQQGGFDFDLATAGPPKHHLPANYPGSDERTVNGATYTEVQLHQLLCTIGCDRARSYTFY